MKKQDRVIAPTFIEGEWEWKNVCTVTHRRWLPLTEFIKYEHIWCFRADGIMISERDGRIVYHVGYSFLPEEKTLRFEGWELDDDGRPRARIDECYRVRIRSRDKIFLYDLEDVTVEPDDYSLRLYLKRIALP